MKKQTVLTNHMSSSSSGKASDKSPDSFQEFRHLCKSLAEEPSYNQKTVIIKTFIKEKSGKKDPFNGDLYTFAKLLLPGTQKRVYNIKDKQLVKFFSQIFQTDSQEMTEHLEDKGIISETVKVFFKESLSSVKPTKKSTLTLQEVDSFLDELASVTKEEFQTSVLQKISKRCTADDLSYMVKLIKHDLRMNTGPKHFLDALDSNAYAAYQASSDLKNVIEKWIAGNNDKTSVPGLKKALSIRATLMTPVKPMLAEACKSVEQAFKKCPSGMFSEIKYDGERVQIHKDGNKFEYFSRSLKSVQPHKISEIKDYIPKACPEGDSLILDGEVLLMDTKTNKPLPFGTLGIHKKSKFTDATVCYVIFDILQFNNDNLLNKPIHERREILLKNVKEIPNRIIHSEMKLISKKEELQTMLNKCFAENLEGLVLKDVNSKYEPGKRHWLKVKKDYLQEGAMADSADLVVLGAYYGTGNKGGLMSVFLMGCYNESKQQWVTVAKCGNGHDDDTIKKLQKELDMVKISKDAAKVPSWLDVNRSLIPDFVSKDPKKSPVWEITGAEFSQSTTHTAAGISIRFPRVTKIRIDKDWKTATSLTQLKKLFEESKKTTDMNIEIPTTSTADEDTLPTLKSKSTENSPQVSPSKSPPKNTSKPTTSIAARKRKTDTAQKELEPKTKQSKQVCQYGSDCYRKNKEHFEEYLHPGKESESVEEYLHPGKESKSVESPKEKSKEEKSLSKSEKCQESPSKELANIFTGLSFIISKGLTDCKKLKRFIIAYNGDVLEDYEKSKATHMVSDKLIEDLDNDKTIVVKPDWIWTCVKKKCLVSTNKKLAFI